MWPSYFGPVVRIQDGERIMSDARWGLPNSKKALFDAASMRADKLRAKGKPVDFDQLLRMEPDGGTTNVRNTASSHWKRWLAPANRCLVPLTSFAEPDQVRKGDMLFALDETEPQAVFAGIWVPQWTSVRKVKEGETTSDVFGFLTTGPNAEVTKIHTKAMPVILTQPDERDAWLTWEWTKDGEPMASRRQRPLPEGILKSIKHEPLKARATG